MQKSKTLLEYIWLDGNCRLRSKSRVVHATLPCINTFIPEWTYDGSSTNQAENDGDTEIILNPCKVYKDPMRDISDCECYLVLCDTYTSNGNPTQSNHRYSASKIFTDEMVSEYEPWFGLEQEYFIVIPGKNVTTANFYCRLPDTIIEQTIVEEHMKLCIEAGLTISGINSEVSPYQWEFQIGPSQGINAADELVVAGFLLEKVALKYGVKINYHPKPSAYINGSGCHINFSTNKTRDENGITEIYRCIQQLSETHDDLIKVYGEHNDMRLTGMHETSSYTTFSWGVGTRNTSLRIPNKVMKEGRGYFEDRRPASNMDPYLATSTLFKTCYPV